MKPLFVILLSIFILAIASADKGSAKTQNSEENISLSVSEFMEEVRGAMSSQWELLQDLRYHTLGIKVRLAQLETKLDTFTSSLSHLSGGADAGVGELVEAVRNLTDLYRLPNPHHDVRPPDDQHSPELNPEDDSSSGEHGEEIAEAEPSTTTIINTGNGDTHQTNAQTEEETKTASEENNTENTDEYDYEVEDEDTEVGHGVKIPGAAGEVTTEPIILGRLSPNVTAVEGGTVSLSCRAKNLQDYKMGWIQQFSQTIVSINELNIHRDRRMWSNLDRAVDGGAHYVLTINNIRPSDSGPYICSINTDPMIYHIVWLTVRGIEENVHLEEVDGGRLSEGGNDMEDTDYNNYSEERDSVDNTVDERREIGKPRILAELSPNVTVTEGSTVTLSCRFQNLNEYKIAWIKVDTETIVAISDTLILRTYRMSVSLDQENGDYTLTVVSATLRDAGQYACHINSDPLIMYPIWLTLVGSGNERHEREDEGEMNLGEHPGHVNGASGQASDEGFNHGGSTQAGGSTAESTSSNNGVNDYYGGGLEDYENEGGAETPRILKELSPNVTATEGSTVTLSCRVHNLGEHTIYWQKIAPETRLSMGMQLFARVSHYTLTQKQRGPEVSYALTIGGVTQADAGGYECHVPAHLPIYHDIWLTVREESDDEDNGEDKIEGGAEEEEENAPRIVGSESNVTAQVGNSATLNCRVENHNEDTVSWYHGSDLLARGFEVVTEDNRFTSTRTAPFTWWLDIADLQTTDTGHYQCRISENHPGQEYSFWLNVLGSPQVPNIVSESSTVSVVRGQPVTLTCRVLNLGEDSISWVRLRDHEILTVDRYTFSADQRFTASHTGQDWELQITSVNEQDAGEYQCQVSTSPPTTRTFRLRIVESRPLLEDTPRSVIVAPGSAATLTCSVVNLGTHAVTWLRGNDKQVLAIGLFIFTNDDRFSVDNQGDDWTLTLEEAIEGDAGDYHCLVPVSDTIITTNFTLLVRGTQLAVAPEDTRAVIGKEVTLTCGATGQPRPLVAWRRRDMPFPLDRLEVQENGDITIRDLGEVDAGWYDCSARNQHGVVDGSLWLTVLRPTRIVRPPRDRQKALGETAVFRCKAVTDSELDVTVEWLKEGERIDFSASQRLGRRPNNALVVSEARRTDQGVYTCRAITSLDTVTANATLTIQGRTKEERGGVIETPPTLDYCPPPFERLRTRVCILQVIDRKLSWNDAARYCRSEGGKLAWAGGETEIFQMFLHERYGLGGDTWTHWPFWVGGHKEEGDEVWRWVDGAPVSPEVWATGHPRDHGGPLVAPEGSCMVLDGYQDYQAASLPCHYRRFFLCRV